MMKKEEMADAKKEALWYNNRKAVIIPRAYRLSEAMR